MTTRITPRATFITWLALLGLTGASFAISYVPLGALNVPVALGIAAVKGALVVLVFMELAAERFTVKVTLVVSVAFIALLVALMMADVLTRAAPPLLPPPP